MVRKSLQDKISVYGAAPTSDPILSHTLAIIVDNEPGVLARVVGLFTGRGYNIESLTVAPTDDPTLSRMTIQTVGDAKVLEQIEKQLNKKLDVIKVKTFDKESSISRELMLIKVKADPDDSTIMNVTLPVGEVRS